MADRRLTPFEQAFFQNRSVPEQLNQGFPADFQLRLDEFTDHISREMQELSRRQKSLEEAMENMRNSPEKPEIVKIL